MMQTLGQVGGTLKQLCETSTFGFRGALQLSSSPNLLLVFGSGYINTVKQFLFLNKFTYRYYERV